MSSLNLSKFFFVCLIISSLSSCNVILKSNTVKSSDVYFAGVIQKPVVVDLDVKETKTTAIVKGSPGELIQITKSNAVALALKNTDSDILVEPKFEIETKGGETKVTVTGFPATYKNFRPISESDLNLLKVGTTQKVEVYDTLDKSQGKGGSKIGVIFGVLAGLVGLLLLL